MALYNLESSGRRYGSAPAGHVLNYIAWPVALPLALAPELS